MNSPDESRFDEQLRRQLAAFTPAPLPEPAAWQRLQTQLPPPPGPPPPGTRLRPFAAGVVVGALLLWGGHRLAPAAEPALMAGIQGIDEQLKTPAAVPEVVGFTAATVAPEAAGAQRVAGRLGQPAERAGDLPAVAGRRRAAPANAPAAMLANRASSLLPAVGLPGGALLPAVPLAAADSSSRRPALAAPAGSATANLPAFGAPPANALPGSWAHALALDTAIRRTLQAPATDTSRAPRLARLLAARQQTLTSLQRALDSLKQALPEAPPALVLADSVDTNEDFPPAPVPADWRTLPAPRSPWAVVALLETTPGWSVLPTAAGADQERTQASLGQRVQVQRTVGSRWRARAGLGQTTLRTQARYTSDRSVTTTRHDSTLTTTYVLHTGTRLVRFINQNTQDTTYATVLTYDTVTTHRHEVITRTETLRDVRQQLFRPEYRFWTLPVSGHYLLVNRNRWSLAVSLGAQLTMFRGGSRPVWTGETYALQRVGAGEGPYRPVSVSFSGGVEAQYRLSPRLSAVLAPTVRWWAVPPGQHGRAVVRTWLPAAQVGLSYGF